jgi:hypothetical protein
MSSKLGMVFESWRTVSGIFTKDKRHIRCVSGGAARQYATL